MPSQQVGKKQKHQQIAFLKKLGWDCWDCWSTILDFGSNLGWLIFTILVHPEDWDDHPSASGRRLCMVGFGACALFFVSCRVCLSDTKVHVL